MAGRQRDIRCSHKTLDASYGCYRVQRSRVNQVAVHAKLICRAAGGPRGSVLDAAPLAFYVPPSLSSVKGAIEGRSETGDFAPIPETRHSD